MERLVTNYAQVAQKCDSFAITLLDKCTTKHEIQTLLQTKSYRGHHDANFNVGAFSSLLPTVSGGHSGRP